MSNIQKVRLDSINGSAEDCKPFGGGSSPPLVLILSYFLAKKREKEGKVAEWSKAADCKSVPH